MADRTDDRRKHESNLTRAELFDNQLLDTHMDVPAVAVERTVSSAAARVCRGGADFAIAAIQRSSRAHVRRLTARGDIHSDESRRYLFGAGARHRIQHSDEQIKH